MRRSGGREWHLDGSECANVNMPKLGVMSEWPTDLEKWAHGPAAVAHNWPDLSAFLLLISLRLCNRSIVDP